MNILITGGNGYIGRYLTDYLSANGHFCYLLTKRKSTFFNDSQLVTQIECDITSNDFAKNINFNKKIDGVFHLAGISKIKLNQNNFDFFRVNTLATFNILELAKSLEVDWYVQASTGTVYGNYQSQDELSFPMPCSLYGATKLSAEQLVHAYRHSFSCTIARVFFPYGRKQPKTQFAANIYHRILTRSYVDIKGSHDGFSFTPIFIDDLVRTLWACHYYNDVLNISGVSQVSIKMFASIIGNEVGIEPIFNIDLGEEFLPDFSPNISRMLALVDSSRFASISEGVRSFGVVNS